MSFHIKGTKQEGLLNVVNRDEAPLDFISLDILSLSQGGKFSIDTGEEEWVCIVFGGRCSIRGQGITWSDVGERPNVFAGVATGFYLPRQTEAVLEAGPGFSMAIAKAPATEKFEPVLVPPEKVQVKVFGAYNWRREVHTVIGATVKANHLIVGETFNPPGFWSSSPPHRHEKDDPPNEVKMEEVYYFKVDPPQGYGLQRLYTDDRRIDEAYALEDGDTVIIPEGYHPVAAAPGYRLYYLWILAGTTRTLCPRDDPKHAWLKSCEPIIRELERQK